MLKYSQLWCHLENCWQCKQLCEGLVLNVTVFQLSERNPHFGHAWFRQGWCLSEVPQLPTARQEGLHQHREYGHHVENPWHNVIFQWIGRPVYVGRTYLVYRSVLDFNALTSSFHCICTDGLSPYWCWCSSFSLSLAGLCKPRSGGNISSSWLTGGGCWPSWPTPGRWSWSPPDGEGSLMVTIVSFKPQNLYAFYRSSGIIFNIQLCSYRLPLAMEPPCPVDVCKC